MREALKQLENEGLVMSFPYRGAVVLGVSDEEVQEVLIPIRLTLERYSFMHALDRITDEEFAELGKEVWLMEQPRGRRPCPTRRGRPALPRDRDLGLGPDAHGADVAHDLRRGSAPTSSVTAAART